jgi:hypothetical protein
MKKENNLAEYLIDKAYELDLSLAKLSKLIKPGSSGSLIGSIKFGRTRLSENSIHTIANFFKEDPIKLTFLAGRIPQRIEKMILEKEELQEILTRELNKWEKKETIKKK